jgi:hypothetical protein
MKLSKQQINEIKELRSKGETQMNLAIKYNVSLGTIAYHTIEKNRLRQIEASKKYFKNLSNEKKKELYNKRKEYLLSYYKNKYNTDESFRNKVKERNKENKNESKKMFRT